MSDAITRCPKCSTSFRITEAHLKSAKGAVRCGSCLNIFNAKENLVSTAPAQLDNRDKADTHTPASKTGSKLEPSASPKTKPQAKPAPPPIEEEDDILISDDMGLEEETKDTGQEEFEDTFLFSSSAGQHEPNLFERALVDGGDDDTPSGDESWALNLLEDSGHEDEKDDPAHQEPFFSDADDLDEAPQPDQRKEQREPPKRKSPFQIIDEAPAPKKSPFKIEEDDGEETYYEHADSAEYLDEKTNEDPGNFQYLHAIEPEPVEFTYKTHRNWTRSKLLWLPLILLATLTLSAQFAWYKFNELSTVQPYRDLYGYVCPYIGCELPALVDRTQIKATNLIVRSHPEAANALLVDAIIQNNAKFQQSFPSLDLVFTDLQNKPVAARRISPNEYLGGELTGKTQMPVRQPVHIAIEIADPGPEAISYFISIPD